MLAEQNKIGIIVLVKYNKKFFNLRSEEPKVIKELEKLDSRMERCVKCMGAYHSVGMNSKFDIFGFYEVTDIGDWEAYSEQFERCFGDYVEYKEVYIGINEPYFMAKAKEYSL
jgi:hypothetical protein